MVDLIVRTRVGAWEVVLNDSIIIANGATKEHAIDEAISSLKGALNTLAIRRPHHHAPLRSLTRTERHQLMADHGCDTLEEARCER